MNKIDFPLGVELPLRGGGTALLYEFFEDRWWGRATLPGGCWGLVPGYWPELEAERDNSCHTETSISAAEYDWKIAELGAERDVMKPWATLGRGCLIESRVNGCGDVDGVTLQDAAIDLGLLEYVTVDKPCGTDGDCQCADYYGPDEWPAQCLRLSARGKEMP